MTGALQLMMAESGTGALDGTATLKDVTTGANSNAGIALMWDGSLSYSGNQTVGPARWNTFSPAPVMYAQHTVNSGTAPTGPTALVPTETDPEAQQVGWLLTANLTGSKSNNCTIRIYADAAGTKLAATINYTTSVQRIN